MLLCSTLSCFLLLLSFLYPINSLGWWERSALETSSCPASLKSILSSEIDRLSTPDERSLGNALPSFILVGDCKRFLTLPYLPASIRSTYLGRYRSGTARYLCRPVWSCKIGNGWDLTMSQVWYLLPGQVWMPMDRPVVFTPSCRPAVGQRSRDSCLKLPIEVITSDGCIAHA